MPSTRRKKPIIDKSKKEEISDLEVAKKMLKIFQSAVDRKLEFDLSFESVKKLLSFNTCYYTSRKFEDDGPFARSFDRIDSAKGYIEGNVVACTVDINGKKSNLSIEELECLYFKLVTKKPKIEVQDKTEETNQETQISEPAEHHEDGLPTDI
jgi:hypothetical protein